MSLPANVDRVLRSVLGPKGTSARDLRKAVATRAQDLCGAESGETALEGALGDYVDKVSLTPYKVVDGDIEKLRTAGFSEDDIFELTVAAALGSARGRFEKALELLEEDSP